MSDIPGLTKYGLVYDEGDVLGMEQDPDGDYCLASEVEAREREIVALLEKVAMPDQGVIRSADPDPVRILSAVLTVMNATRDEAQRLLGRLR